MNLPAASPRAPLYLCHSAVVKLNNFALIPSQAGTWEFFVFFFKMDSRLFFSLIWGKRHTAKHVAVVQEVNPYFFCMFSC